MTKPQEPKRYKLREAQFKPHKDFMLAEEAIAYSEAVRDEAEGMVIEAATFAIKEARKKENNEHLLISFEGLFLDKYRSLKREGK